MEPGGETGQEGQISNKEVTATMNQWLNTEVGTVQRRAMRLAVDHPFLKLWFAVGSGAGILQAISTRDIFTGLTTLAGIGAAYTLYKAEDLYRKKEESVRDNLNDQAQQAQAKQGRPLGRIINKLLNRQ